MPVEDEALAAVTVWFEPRSTRVMRAGKVRPGKASTTKLACWPSFTSPTSASSIATSSFMLVRSSAITNSVGVLNDAATVWPGSTWRARTTPDTGLRMIARARCVCDWASCARAAATLACATRRAATARCALARPVCSSVAEGTRRLDRRYTSSSRASCAFASDTVACA